MTESGLIRGLERERLRFGKHEFLGGGEVLSTDLGEASSIEKNHIVHENSCHS